MDSNERLQQYLEYIESNVKDATDFAKEQAPLVVQELIQWEITKGTIAGILLSIIVIVMSICLSKGFNKISKCDPTTTEWEKAFFTIVAGMVLIIPLLFITPMCLFGLKAYVAPRLVVLEQVRELVR